MRILALPIVLLALIVPRAVLALGLGEISVDSTLNQPLSAEIKMFSVERGEIDDIKATLASQDVFQRVGIDRPFYLTKLRFQPVDLGNGNAVLKISTREAVREPFLTFLVEVKWTKGRLLREYTILLDPPVFLQAGAPAQTTAPEIQAQASEQRSSQPSRPERVTTSTAPAARASETPSRPEPAGTAEGTSPESYTTKKGDTLWSIAEDVRPSAEVDVAAMMLALQRTNSGAFIKNNINNLRAGEILRIPDSDEINKLSSQQVVAEIKRQDALWQEYTRSIAAAPENIGAGQLADAGEQESAVDESSIESKSDSSNAVVEESSPSLEILAPQTDPENLQQVVAAGGAEAIKTLRNELALAREAAESRARENQELRERLQQLEQLREKQERVLSLQNDQLAELQQGLSQASESSEEAVTEQVAPLETAEIDENVEAPEAQTEESAAGEQVGEPLSAIDSELDDQAEREAMKDYYANLSYSADGTAGESAAEPVAEQPEETAVTDETVALVEDSAEGTEAAAAPPTPAETMQPGIIEQAKSWLNNPVVLMIVAVLGLLIAALVWIVLRRVSANREASSGEFYNFEDQDSSDMLEDTIVTEANKHRTGTAQHASPKFDSEEASEPHVAAGTGDAEEPVRDDVLDDADVYIGYALYQQAEELLKEAISNNPGNNAYRVKLVETYYASKDSQAFDMAVESLHNNNVSDSDWHRVVAMGEELSPGNPLFSNADSGVSAQSGSFANTSSKNSLNVDDGELTLTLDDTTVEPNAKSSAQGLEDENMVSALEFTEANDADDATDLTSMDVNETIAFDMNEAEASLDEDTDEDAFLKAFGDEDKNVAATVISSADNSNILEFDAKDFAKKGFGLDEAEGIDDDMLSDDNSLDITGMGNADDLDATRVDDELPDIAGLGVSDDGDDKDDSLATLIDDDLSSFANDSSLDDSTDKELEDVDLTAVFDGSGDSAQKYGTSDPDPEATLIDDSLIQEDEIKLDDTMSFDVDSFGDGQATETFNMDDQETEILNTDGLNQGLNPAASSASEAGIMSSVDEVGTKLDLAKAYIDMGDTDGARSTLAEVIEEGNDTQREQAEELMAQCN